MCVYLQMMTLKIDDFMTRNKQDADCNINNQALEFKIKFRLRLLLSIPILTKSFQSLRLCIFSLSMRLRIFVTAGSGYPDDRIIFNEQDALRTT